MIPVKVKEVVLDQMQNPLLLLVDLEETMVLPIGIGFWEAQAIILKLQGHLSPRPLTHDLIQSLCGRLGAEVTKIVITDMKESTFYAEIVLLQKSSREEIVVDARPSDAVALALTVGCPIFISSKVSTHTITIKDLMEERENEMVELDDLEDEEGSSQVH